MARTKQTARKSAGARQPRKLFQTYSPLDWEKSKLLLTDKYHLIYSGIDGYGDHEIDGKITENDINELLNNLPSQDDLILKFPFIRVEVVKGEEGCIYRWEFKNEGRLEYGYTDEQMYIAYQDNKFTLICGNNNGHPFVLTNQFSFHNSDGSTETLFLNDKTTENVFTLMKKLIKNYILNQIH